MKIRLTSQLLVALLVVVFTAELDAQSTTFTYQGRLTDGGIPASGGYELEFTLHDAANGGSAVGGPVTNSLVTVSNGLFTTTLDFGAGVFTGEERWLEIGVRTNDPAAAFVTLSERQPLTATPYAIRSIHAASALTALTADTAYTVIAGSVDTDALLPNAVTSAKIEDRTIMAADLSSVLASNTFWRLGGNAGTTPGTDFIGTTDNLPLEFKVNGTRLFRLEHTGLNTANIIGGSPDNYVAPGLDGVTIAGGGLVYDTYGLSNVVRANFASIGGGFGNTIETGAQSATIPGGDGNNVGTNALLAVIGGGAGNAIQANAEYAAIGGGFANVIEPGASSATIGGGATNTIQTNAIFGAVGGGVGNQIYADAVSGTIAGGNDNYILNNAHATAIGGGAGNVIEANAIGATIPGGEFNRATNYGFAAGRRAKANHTGTFVWADSMDADFASTANNQFNVRAHGGVRFETSGAGMTLDGQPVVAGSVGPGQLTGSYSNQVSFIDSGNTFAGNGASLTSLNASQLTTGIVPAGALGNAWKLGGNAGTTPGADFIGTADNQPLEFKVNNARALRLEPVEDNFRGTNVLNVIAGSPWNSVASLVRGATISGGGALGVSNFIHGNFGVIAGGSGNRIEFDAHYAVIGGGLTNRVPSEATYATIAGGRDNAAMRSAFVGGGERNKAFGSYSAICGGADNELNGSSYSFIGGGESNSLGGGSSVIGGGIGNFIGDECGHAVIGGGNGNAVASNGGAVMGGTSNWIAVASYDSVIGGGERNHIQADSEHCVIGGGENNSVYSYGATIGGGRDNSVGYDSFYATIPGGRQNEANSPDTFASGYRAKANDWGAFVWADSTEADFTSTRANEFAIRASGGLRLHSNRGISLNAANTPIITRAYDVFDATVPEKEGHGRWGLFMEPSNLVLGIPNVPGRQLQVAKYDANGSRSELVHVDQAGNMVIAGVYGSSSDRNAKENFAGVNPAEVLAKVVALPISRWNFKQDPGAEHVGPMAQDFHAAFDLGADDKHIATVDADGVALAAIQGLNKKVEQQSAENAELKQRLAQLEQLVQQLTK